MQGHVFKPIGANRMYDWQHCVICNLLSDNPVHIMTFAGMETAVADQATAAAEYTGQELTRRLLEPRKSIDARTQAIENDSPLFYGVINPTLF